MEGTERVATWLELAAAPLLGEGQSKVKLHPVGHKRGGCFAISMDGRWLCAGNGDLTIFKGIEAALHFLKLLRVEAFEPGEAAPHAEVCGHKGHYCLKADRNKGLLPCRVHLPVSRRVVPRRH